MLIFSKYFSVRQAIIGYLTEDSCANSQINVLFGIKTHKGQGVGIKQKKLTFQ
jgi:hypothetical protein